jgi:N-acetylglucosamine-6-phosphate deacetylase
MRQALTNATVYTGKQTLTGVAVLTSKGKIDGFAYDNDIPSGYDVRDLKGNTITAAFIDLQIYGGNGFLFSADPSFEAIEATKNYCIQGGATKFLLTVATNSNEVYSKSIAVAKQYLKEGGKNFLGLHIEGPWISPEKRGAHKLEFIHSPTLEEVKSLVEEAEGSVKIITLAPETVDEKIVDYLQQSGIIVSAGHSNATYQQAMKGFEKIGIATHLFNAMSPFQSRAPGMVGAIYDHPSVISSIVADGIHVDFAALRISKKILGDRLFLITDAVAETSSGPYQHIFKTDRYVIPDGTLSGSALTIMKAVKNCVQHMGVELEEALKMGSLYPAKVIRMENEVGLIEKNYEASFVVFDKELEVVEVIEE